MRLVKDAIINKRGTWASGACLVTYGLYDMSLHWGMLFSLKSLCRKYLSCISMDSRIIFVHLHYRAASRRSVSRLQPVTLTLRFLAWKSLRNLFTIYIPRPIKSISGPVAFGAGGGASGYRWPEEG